MKKAKLIREGETEFFIPESIDLECKGPGKKVEGGFYNPAMEESRDLSVLVAQALANEKQEEVLVLDALSSVGARGLRIANEAEGNVRVVLNDWNREAIEFVKRSIEHNGLENAETRCENLNVLLCKERFHYIDIDPFGSPVPYISLAVRAVRANGILGVTATDTATLCGIYKRTCLRRYSSIPLKTWCMHEIGLRILIGYIVREGARFDRAVYPIFSYSTKYYMRAYFRIKRGAKKANKVLENIGMLKAYDFGFKENEVGPLWVGDIHDRNFLLKIRKLVDEKDFRKKRYLGKLLDRCIEETGMPPLFYDIDALSAYFRVSPPKLSKVMKLLEKEGFRVSRTHFRIHHSRRMPLLKWLKEFLET